MSISAIGQIDASTAGAGQEPSGADFNAAVSQSRIGVPVEGGAPGASKLDNLLERLISTLQQPGSGGPQPTSPIMPEGPGPVEPQRPGPRMPQPIGPVMPGSFQPQGADGSSRQHEAHLLQRVISLLNNQLDSGKLDQQQASLVGELLPKLEEKFVSSAEPHRHSGGETKLLEELATSLDGSTSVGTSIQTSTLVQPPVPGTEDETATNGSAAYDPSAGISGAEINAMLANANGQGPEVNFAAWNQQPSSEQSAG